MPLKLTAQNQALALALKIAGRFFASDAVLGCFARRLDPAVLPGAQAIVQPFKNWLGHPAKFPLGFRLGASESLARWLRYPLQKRLFFMFTPFAEAWTKPCDDSDSPGAKCLSRPPVPALSGLRNPRIGHVMGRPARLTMSAGPFTRNCPQKPKSKSAAWRQPP